MKNHLQQCQHCYSAELSTSSYCSQCASKLDPDIYVFNSPKSRSGFIVTATSIATTFFLTAVVFFYLGSLTRQHSGQSQVISPKAQPQVAASPLPANTPVAEIPVVEPSPTKITAKNKTVVASKDAEPAAEENLDTYLPVYFQDKARSYESPAPASTPDYEQSKPQIYRSQTPRDERVESDYQSNGKKLETETGKESTAPHGTALPADTPYSPAYLPSYSPAYNPDRSSGSSETVRGYTRKDGTYVAPYRRTTKDATTLNNYSTKGNVNPYTGKRGSKRP